MAGFEYTTVEAGGTTIERLASFHIDRPMDAPEDLAASLNRFLGGG